MNPPDLSPLDADPLRQATASLRGYSSQIIRTTRAWADLEDGEVLYIEGAEDFDRVAQGGSAEAVQVRDVSGNITLSTREVREALVHFWTHRRRNPERKVSYRYLTTAGRGRERDTRFGDRPGLDYWDDCKASGTDLHPLREFLAERLSSIKKGAGRGDAEAQPAGRDAWNETVANLVTFVRESPDEEFRDDLIRAVTWETASPNWKEVAEELEVIVIEMGERLHAAKPTVAKKAVPQLILHVWNVACSDRERALRRADFLTKLEEIVDDVRVPLEEYNRLRAAASQSEGAALPAEPASSSWYAEVLRDQYTAARKAATSGRLKEAEEKFQGLLESVRKDASVEDPERRHFEQGILLSRAQNALRAGNATEAASLHREAAALGRFEGRNRHLTGWVLTNLGRLDEAIEELEPSDGSPEWESTLAIALILSGRMRRFRELFGDDQAQNSPEVILALVRHYVGTDQAARAEHLARRLVSQDDGTPEARFRAVEAGFAIFHFVFSSLAAPPVDSGEWILILRRLFSDSVEVMGGGVPLLRLLVLRRQIEFHEALSEGDEAAKGFRTLVEAAPEMAAEIAACGVSTPSPIDLMAAREGARDPVHTAIIDALYFDTDNSVTVQRLRELKPAAEGPEREMLLVMLLELSAAQGEDPDELMEQTGQMSDPVSQRIVQAEILRQGDRPEDARKVVETALREHPASLRLLRVAYGLSRNSGPSEEEVDLAERIYARLPAPEFRLQLADSRMRTGDVDGALRETEAVEKEGERKGKAAYMSAQFALQARRMNEYAAAARRFYEFDGSDRGHLYAAMAALRARQYGRAEKLYRGLLEAEDREVRLHAFGGLAHSIDAQGERLSSAREQSVEVLLEGYDRLDAPPEIAGALYYRALGTRFEKVVHERIGRDFGSLANLPGMIAIPAEEGLEMIRREQEGAKLRIELFQAGVLSFEAAASLGARRASYLWFAHRRSRALMVVQPPRRPRRPDDVVLQGERPKVLVDRTALLTLVETKLLERVLQSELTLYIERETYDWLEDEEHALQAEARPVQRQGLEDLFKTLGELANVEVMQPTEVDEDLLEGFQKALSWGDSYELACARRDELLIIDDFIDVEDVPEEERSRYWRSGDLLRALVATEQISLADAASAQEYRPSAFGKSRGGPVSPNGPFLITHGALGAWHDCGLLKPLAEGVDRLVVSPLAARHSREQLEERAAEADALAAVSRLREKVVAALNHGQARLIRREEDESADSEPESEEGLERGRDLLDWIGDSLRRTYNRAVSVGASIWSDDPAVHLYLDPIGPMISGSPEVVHLASSLRGAYPSLNVVGTSDVMVWLEKMGLLTRTERIEFLSDLSAHGRVLTDQAAVFQTAAESRAAGSTGASVLDAAEVMPAVLTLDVVRRFSPQFATTLAAAIANAWFREDVPKDERASAVSALTSVLRPWVAPSLPHARFVAESLWTALVVELVQRLGPETEKLLRLILAQAAQDEAEFRHFLPAVWKAIDLLHEMTIEGPPEARRLGGMLVALIAVAAQEVQVRGRPILPDDMIRLAADRFGEEGLLTHAASYGIQIDGEERLFTVEDQALEEAAADAVNRLVEDAPEAAPANVVPVEVEATSHDGTVKVPFPGKVNVVRILGRLSSDARKFAVASLALYYREHDRPEIADSLDGLADDIASEEPATADAARSNLLTTLLENPRLWAEHDAHRAFSLLREAPLKDLEKVAGNPEPWVSGENLADRVVRIRQHLKTANEYLEDIRATWGPFEVAVEQYVQLSTSAEAAEGASQDSFLFRIRTAITTESPYDRVLALGTALAMAHLRPDLADVQIGELEVAFQARSTRFVFDGPAGKLLAELVVRWLTNEFEPPALEDFDGGADRSGDALDLDQIASVHALLDRLAVGVERYVYRAVFSERHGAEATAQAAGIESRDPIGDLLLLGHRLTPILLRPFLHQTHRRGLVAVIRDIEEAHDQFPLSQGRVPVGEVFVPEALGTGGTGVNPSLVFLLSCLLRLEQSRLEDTEEGPAKEGTPFWWTEDVHAALQALARREGLPQLRNLQNVAHKEGVLNRFGSLLTSGVEGHAERLLALLDRG